MPGVTPQPIDLHRTVEMPDYRGPIEYQLPRKSASEHADEAAGAAELKANFETPCANLVITGALRQLSIETDSTSGPAIGRTTMAGLPVVVRLIDLESGASALQVSLLETHQNPEGRGRQWFSFKDFESLPKITQAYISMAAQSVLEIQKKETDALASVRAREMDRDAMTQGWETYPWIGIGDGKIDLSSHERLWRAAINRELTVCTRPGKSTPILRVLVNDHTPVLVTRRNGQAVFHRYAQEGVDLKSESAWSMNP